MSFGSANPADLLANKEWRRRHSAWLLAPIFGCGLLSFVGFLYCAVRIGSARWWKIAAMSAAVTVPGYVLMTLFASETDPKTGEPITDVPGPWDDVAVAYVLAVWLGLLIYAVVLNREYLRWRAGDSEANAWYRQPTGQLPLASPPISRPPSEPPPRHAATEVLGTSRADYYAPSPAAAAPTPPVQPPPAPTAPPPPRSTHIGPVDMNSASASEIVGALGLDANTAERIVTARVQRGGFQNVDDLVAAVGLQPHEMVKVRGKVSFGGSESALMSPRPPNDQEPPPERRGGRILDF